MYAGCVLAARESRGHICNGSFWTVAKIEGDKATLTSEHGAGATLSASECKIFGLAAALCFFSCQGRTLPGVVRLYCGSPRLTTRALIVGLSRATAGDLLEVVQ